VACAVAAPAGIAASADYNEFPYARLKTSARTVEAGRSVLLDASRSRDPDGRVVRYLWDLNGDGDFETGTGKSAKLRDILASPGRVTVGLRVVDDRGGFAERHVQLEATPRTRDGRLSGHRHGGARLAPATNEPADAKHGKAKQHQKGAAKTETKPAALHSAAATTVTIKSFAFHPTAVTVHPGDTVTWTNQDSTGHSATANDSSFNTGILKKGSSGSFRFTKAGTFGYHCTPHPNMKAQVVVAASNGSSASTAGDTPSGGSSDPSSGDSPGSSGSSGSSLPHTGLELSAVALAGLALLGSGVVLRRRVARGAVK
jgi:LPXTG-motif cell wall-anchored protein